MAWPLTPYRTMTDGTSKWDEDLGNALQDGVNQVVAGTTSLIGVTVDGTGGVAVAAEAGAVKVSKTVAAAGAPSAALSVGSLYKDMIPRAWGFVEISGGVASLTVGAGVSAVSRAGLGVVDVTILNAASDDHKICPVVCGSGENVNADVTTYVANNRFTVRMTLGQTAPSGGRIDAAFFFVVYGA